MGASMNRRRFLQTLGLTGLAPFIARAEQPSARAPNIVYILADDMGYGDVSALNPESKIPTPHIDRLAKEGLIFTDAHSNSAVCTPTRYGILTGRYCWRSSLKSGVLNGFSPPLIEKGRMTVASFLKENGYATACFGKWHLGMAFPKKENETDWSGIIKGSPIANGFDTYHGIAASLDMPPYIWIHDNRFVGTCTTQKSFSRKGPAHADFEAVDVLPEIGRRTVAYIEKQTPATPFFIYVPLTSPHTPIVPEKAFKGKSPLGAYGDFCMQTDAVVGEICAALEKQGFSGNTLVIFTSDNGCAPYVGVGNLEKKGHFPSAGKRGYKADIFEGGHRIPYVVRWPGKIKPGSKSDETICLTDFLATCADILGKKLPRDAGEDSISTLPVMLGQDYPKPLREATVHHSINGSFAIRQGKWKLENCPDSGGWSAPKPKSKEAKALPPIQLYNLETDPTETKNLHAEHPEIVKRLSDLLEKYKREGRSV